MTVTLTEEQARSQASTIISPYLSASGMTSEQAAMLIKDITTALQLASKETAQRAAKHLGRFNRARRLQAIVKGV